MTKAFDPNDVDVLAELEAKTRAWIADVQSAVPALNRLEAAGFAGAGWVLSEIPDDEKPDCFGEGTAWALIDALVDTQHGQGDEFTLDWIIQVG